MAFQKLVKIRESVRNYDPDRKIERDKLDGILEAGRLAPSAGNRQPWRFYVISSRENLEKIRTCYHQPWFKQAPYVLVVAGKRSDAWTRAADGYNALETDLTIAMDHMILAAAEEGIGTCWIAAFDPEKLKNTGLLDPDEEVFAITPLGYPGKDYRGGRHKIRKAKEEVVKFI